LTHAGRPGHGFRKFSTGSTESLSEEGVQKYKAFVQHAEDDYPESWNEAVQDKNVTSAVFTELYLDAAFSKHVQSDIIKMKNDGEQLRFFKMYVFLHFAEKHLTFSKEQFLHMSQYAGLHLTEIPENVTGDNFDGLVMKTETSLADALDALYNYEKVIESIFYKLKYDSADNMSIQQFNQFLDVSQSGIDMIRDGTFEQFIRDYKLDTIHYNEDYTEMKPGGFQEFVFKYVSVDKLKAIQRDMESASAVNAD